MTAPDSAESRTVSSEVIVSVDPVTAFTIFTDEIDRWWVRGPINFFDSSRAIGMRCEPGVGGRLLELYSEDASDALVLGRITTWQPGELLAWESAVDDVQVQVRFAAVPAGTKVALTAAIPAGGADRGGTAWLRVVPRWLPAWCQRRGLAEHAPADTGRLGLAISYARPADAARWLADVFGLAPADELGGDDHELGGDDYDQKWIEFRIGTCSVMLFQRNDGSADGAAMTHVPWVFVDDLDAHFERARSRGATMLSGIRQHGYRAYEAADLEGYRWLFAQARPTMTS